MIWPFFSTSNWAKVLLCFIFLRFQPPLQTPQLLFTFEESYLHELKWNDMLEAERNMGFSSLKNLTSPLPARRCWLGHMWWGCWGWSGFLCLYVQERALMRKMPSKWCSVITAANQKLRYCWTYLRVCMARLRELNRDGSPTHGVSTAFFRALMCFFGFPGETRRPYWLVNRLTCRMVTIVKTTSPWCM